MEPNPYTVTIPAGGSGRFSCQSNAQYNQFVALFGDGTPTAMFQGSGEGVTMLTEGGGDTAVVASLIGNSQISALFFHWPSVDGGETSFSLVTILSDNTDQNGVRTIQVGSDDGGATPPDWNDSVLTIVITPQQ